MHQQRRPLLASALTYLEVVTTKIAEDLLDGGDWDLVVK